ncbi:unnamed protein product [Oikopleura dioica]|uniref:LRRNT domain-containing protein n=1 Tax=Oikopleura dioica TaxID=34765 RepID=E4X269_OIKDI|nr:unnamed protein product [Oikopleura dioica]CBY41625.1 unnamed protein product [Oikopleura dioica]
MRASSILLSVARAACPDQCSCEGTVVDCTGAQIQYISDLDFPSDVSEINLSGSSLSALRSFDFNGDNGAFANLDSVIFDNSSIDFIDDSAFAYLPSLKSASFAGSSVSYVSKKAFYNCDALEDADFSDSNLKYLDGHFLIYADSLKTLNVDGSVECDCVNNWMKLSDFDDRISGYGCEINLEDASKCAPKAVLPEYEFTFEEGQPATAICFIVGSDIMTIDVQNGGNYRGQRINFHTVGTENHDEYTCTANALNHESVQNFFTINVVSREEINENTVENSSAEEIGGNAENEVAEEVDEIIEENQEDQSENIEITSEILSTERPTELEVISEEITGDYEPSNEVTNDEEKENSWENINTNTACLFGILCDEGSSEGSSEGSGSDGSGDFEEFSSAQTLSLLSASPASLVLILLIACLL